MPKVFVVEISTGATWVQVFPSPQKEFSMLLYETLFFSDVQIKQDLFCAWSGPFVIYLWICDSLFVVYVHATESIATQTTGLMESLFKRVIFLLWIDQLLEKEEKVIQTKCNFRAYIVSRYCIIRAINKIRRSRSGSPICQSWAWLQTELDDKKSCFQLIITVTISKHSKYIWVKYLCKRQFLK